MRMRERRSSRGTGSGIGPSCEAGPPLVIVSPSTLGLSRRLRDRNRILGRLAPHGGAPDSHRRVSMIIALASPRIASTLDEGLDKVRWLLSEASTQGAEIVCFPEAYLPGLRGQDFEVL